MLLKINIILKDKINQVATNMMMTKEQITEKWWPIIEKIKGVTKEKDIWLCQYAHLYTQYASDIQNQYPNSAGEMLDSLLAVGLKIGAGVKSQLCKVNFEGVTENQDVIYDFSEDELLNYVISPESTVKAAEQLLIEKAINFVNSKISEVKLKSNGEEIFFNVRHFVKSLALITLEDMKPRMLLRMEFKIGSKSYDELLLQEKQEMAEDTAVGSFVQQFKKNIQRVVLEESKEYYWLRLYLREECEIENSEIIKLKYLPNDESLDLIFIAYEKKGQSDQFYSDIIEYVKEDDKKILCLMLDIKELNTRTDLEFLQKLLRCSRNHEDTLVKREDLPFMQQNAEGEWIPLDYYDADF